MCSVLIIEDDRDTNEAVAAALASEKYDCLTAYDGLSGLQALVDRRPDLVLLDLELPGIEGTELLLRKSKLRAVADIPVIVITAISNPPRLDGTVGTLRKPFSLEELLGAVGEVARRASATAAG